MPTSPTDRAQRIARIGVTEDGVQALEHIWDTETFRLTADMRTAALCDFGYDPLDALDAIWHELDESTAHLYMQHGLTPHQAFLLDSNRQAQTNLWGPHADTDRVHELLGMPIDPDLLVAVLATATTPDEAGNLLDSCVSGGAQADSIIAEVRSRSSALPVRIDACDCA